MLPAIRPTSWPWWCGWCWPTTTTATTTTTTRHKQSLTRISSLSCLLSLLMVILTNLALLSHHVGCDTPLPGSSNHSKPLYFTRRAIDNAPSSSTFDSNRTHQPLINHSQFCGEPPAIANAQSNLKRNQKHFVWALGTKASYMCDQGYRAVGLANAETRCTVVPEEDNNHNPRSSSFIFPGPTTAHVDVGGASALEHHFISLATNSRRYKNSKRLFAIDADEESETDANSATPNGFAMGSSDKRKSSRKHEDDFMFYETDDAGARHGGDDDANATGKRNRAEKGGEDSRAVRWWPPVTLNCQAVNCTDPGEIENGRRRDPPATVYGFNSNVQYECLTGYEPVGIPIMTCRADGQWNRPPPKCKPIQCPALPVLANGKLFYSDPERIVDSKVEYHCNGGYKLNAFTMTRVCRPNGKWAALEPLLGQLVPEASVNASSDGVEPYRCQPIQCSLPLRPHAGLRIVSLKRNDKTSPFKPGDLIFFSCDTLKGVRFASKCLDKGEWSRSPPDCPPPKECAPLPTTLANGNVTIKSTTMVKFGCVDGFELKGATLLSCAVTGEWSAAVPSCVPATNKSSTIIDVKTNTNINGSLERIEKQDKDAQEAAMAESERNSSRLTYLLVVIFILTSLVSFIGFLVYRRWQRNLKQRKRWQQYFGHYHNRQSRTNIIMSSTHGVRTGSGRPSADMTTTGFGGAPPTGGKKSTCMNKNAATVKAATGLLQSSSFSSADESGVETIKSDGRGHTLTTYADTVLDEEEELEEDEGSESSEYYESISTTRSPPPPSQPPPTAMTTTARPPLYSNLQANREKVIPVTDL